MTLISNATTPSSVEPAKPTPIEHKIEDLRRQHQHLSRFCDVFRVGLELIEQRRQRVQELRQIG